MLQDGGVYTAARPPEVLRLFAAYYDDPADPDELLERVGLAEHRRIDVADACRAASSSGCRWRSRSSGRPEVAFLDEPTAGIDPSGRQLIRRVIAELRDDGRARCCSPPTTSTRPSGWPTGVVIIDRGRVLAAGTPAELMASGRARRDPLRRRRRARRRSRSARAVGAPVVEVAPGEYRVDAEPTPATVAALTAWLAERDLALGDLRAGRQRLEDVFLRLTESAAAAERPDR